jgi:trk system potassium uptake protein TrkA
MKVLICGAGLVGASIARQLATEGNSVTVVDLSADLIREITDELDVRGLVGHGAYPDTLDKAGAAESDMLIAVTHSDEVNMVACQVAHSLFNVPLKIARVRAQSYLKSMWQDLFSKDHLPIDVTISPELEVAQSVLRRLDAPGSFEVMDFASGRVQVVGVRIEEDCPVVDTPLRQLTELFPDLHAVVAAIVRGGELFVPSSSEEMAVGDDVYFISARERVRRTLDIFGHPEREARRVIIIGAGHIGLSVAREIEERHASVKVRVIEANKAQAELAADQLSRTVVLFGDGLDQQVLAEAGAADAEAIIAVTNNDEVNILASVLAKQAGAKRALALINNTAYGPLTRSLDIDAYINPRATTVSTIMQHVRRGRIKALQAIYEGEAEVIEAEALATSPLVGRPLRDAQIPDGIIIGAVVRKDTVIFPRGETEIETGDRVVTLARRDVVRKVEQLFRVSLDYF